MMPTGVRRTDWLRWVACGTVVLGLHAGGAAGLAMWHEPILPGDSGAPIVVTLAPIAAAPNETVDNLAPGPLQEKFDPPPEPPVEKQEAKIEDKIEPPPDVKPEVVLPPPEPIKPPPKKVEPVQRQRAPATTAPQRQPRVAALSAAPAVGTAESRADAASWHGLVRAQIERHKSYPDEARAHGDKGVVQLAFTIDRAGRVLSSAITRSSGSAALDQKALATARRAQPFPPPPADVPGTRFAFTVPLKFNIR